MRSVTCGAPLAGMQKNSSLPWTYIVLFPLIQIISYWFPSASIIAATIILLYSYYLIIFRGLIEPIILLAIFARSFVGFSAAGNSVIYLFFNIATNYAPTFLYSVLFYSGFSLQKLFKTNKLTGVYCIILFIYLIIGLPGSIESVTLRFIPMIALTLILSYHVKSFDIQGILRVFRLSFLVAIIMYFAPGYLEKSTAILNSNLVFGTEDSEAISNLGYLFRALGAWWDPRIMGLFGVLYLAMTFAAETRPLRWVDVTISLFGIFLTLSRGAIGTALIIMAFYVIQKMWSQRKIKTLILIVMISAIFSATTYNTYSETIDQILSISDVTPFEQRAPFSDYAIDKFLNAPWGIGLGGLHRIDDGVNFGYTVYYSITDAFHAIQLAEIGIVGYILFILSFKELTWGLGWVSKAISIGVVLQMVGTDIPNFGMIYFAFLMLVNHIVLIEHTKISDLRKLTS